MRGELVLVFIVACGSTAREVQTDEQRVADKRHQDALEQERACRLLNDANCDQYGIELKAKYPPPPDAGMVAVVDARPRETNGWDVATDAAADDVEIDAGVSAVDAKNNWETVGVREDEVENGVTVRHVSAPVWCLKGGKMGGLCNTADGCTALAKKEGGRCEKRSSWACFENTARTTGKQKFACWETYRLCDQVADELSKDVENVVTSCIIVRAP